MHFYIGNTPPERVRNPHLKRSFALLGADVPEPHDLLGSYLDAAAEDTNKRGTAANVDVGTAGTAGAGRGKGLQQVWWRMRRVRTGRIGTRQPRAGGDASRSGG
jgi:hypothetical protein